ncbi:hypothetical protein ACFQNF_15535, partial [Iodobacter arcticus]
MVARFTELCRAEPLSFAKSEQIERDKNSGDYACTSCDQDIFLGFFFDGTNNNKYYSTENFSHSNIARLYEVY